MRILITNLKISSMSGTETYVRDLALDLQRRGHEPIVYGHEIGECAWELQRASVETVDDLKRVSAAPDIIHGHHHVQTMAALTHFPGVPAIFVCHGRLAWHDAAPRFPRIHRYVAVDDHCRERLVLEDKLPEAVVRVIFNAVDLERFMPRAPLPKTPKRALVFSNYATEETSLGMIREACRRKKLSVDVIGAGSGNSYPHPESVLGNYDLVFAKARCALEAMAVGAAVVLCDTERVGPMVSTPELSYLRPLNFGMKTITVPMTTDALLERIDRYDAEDAARVSEWVRDTSGLGKTVEALLGLYEEVIAEQERSGPPDLKAEERAIAEYLSSLLFPQILQMTRDGKERA